MSELALSRPKLGLRETDVRKGDRDVGSNIAFCLQTKGYCTIGDGCEDSLLKQALGEVDALAENDRLVQPAELIQDGLLGADGSARICELAMTDFSQDGANPDGEALGKLDLTMWSLVKTFAPYQESVGIECTSRSGVVVHQTGESFEEVPLTDMEADKWSSIFLRQKVLVLLFLGPDIGTLELCPNDEDAIPTDIMTYPGLIVLVRTDQLTFKYTSAEASSCLSCFFLQDSILRMHRVVREAHMTPAAEAIEEWIQERLREMKGEEKEDTVWGEDVPRNFVLAMNHQFFKIQMTAIYGIGIRAPSTWKPETWSKSCLTGVDYAIQVPYQRWDHDSIYDASEECWQMNPPRTNCGHASFIDGIELFDCKMFHTSPAESSGMDPTQRLSLEVGYEALYMAGKRQTAKGPDGKKDEKRTLLGSSCGVYIGSATTEWGTVARDVGACGATGSSAAVCAGRMSFCLGLKGACLAIDTEAAAALTATYYACESVQVKGTGRQQDFSISVGVLLNLAKAYWPVHTAAGLLCAKGRCMTFDSSAAGHIRGEGAGCFMVEQLREPEVVDGEEVKDDWKHLQGIFASGHSNHSGRTASLHAPSAPSIQEVLQEACRKVSIQPEDVDGCEVHGAGQLLQDAVDVVSASKGLRPNSNNESLLITSCKTNVGNGIEMAGMFALIKAVHNIRYGAAAGNIHLYQLNPHLPTRDDITDETYPITLATETLEFRLKSTFWTTYGRGIAGMNVNLVNFGSVDEALRLPPKAVPEESKPKLIYWPQGGGFLEGENHPREGYFITGSFNQWSTEDRMAEEGAGVYGFTVTLGDTRWEQFLIVIDGDFKRALHPNRYKAPKGTMLFGPDDIGGTQSTWLLDGRTQYTAYESITDGSDTKHDFEEQATADAGKPGTQFRVRLHVSGKWRTVSWTKCGFDEGAKGALGKYYLHGSWNQWDLAQATEMTGDGVKLEATVTSGGHFVIVRNMDMGQVLYPLAVNADMNAQVAGPEDQMYDTQWHLQAPTNASFKITLKLTDANPEVTWAPC